MRFLESKCIWWLGSTQTHWGSFSTPPDALATNGGGVLLLRGRGGKGRGEEGG